jgi:hypothetical protein
MTIDFGAHHRLNTASGGVRERGERGIEAGPVILNHIVQYITRGYLLAKWREPRAYPYVIRWLSLPGEGAFDIAGDFVTQDGPRIIAGVCDGDLEPIKTLILDTNVNESCRAVGVSALAALAAWAELPRKPIVDYFLWLASEGLEREPGQVWNSLAADSADIDALDVFPVLRRAYELRRMTHPTYCGDWNRGRRALQRPWRDDHTHAAHPERLCA